MPEASLDILVPFFNERDVMPKLLDRLRVVFAPEKLAGVGVGRARAIFIDDGSTDESAAIVADAIRAGFPGLLLRLSRNFGHQPALTAGFDHADAEFIAVIDADLQDPPELVLPMIGRLREGFDIVYAKRQKRSEGWLLRFSYWLFYRMLAVLSEVKVPVDAGDFGVMRKPVLDAIRAMPERLRFHRGLRSWVGFRQSAFLYDRPARAAGKTKYTLFALYELATNGVASITIRPLRITQAVLSFSLLLTLLLALVSFVWIARNGVHDSTTLLLLATQLLLAIFSSLQIACLYMLGAYVGRMYLEVKGRPAYIIQETFGPR